MMRSVGVMTSPGIGVVLDVLVAGAAWTATADSPEDTGRQPLAVEAVTAGHAAELVPGVITTTPHARYLSLHARVALEAQARGWADDGDRLSFQRLLRRAEVVLSAVSVHHDETNADDHRKHGGTRGPHGVNAIKRWLTEHGSVDIDKLSGPYSGSANGFYDTYIGIEATLGLIQPGAVPLPAGPAADPGDLGVLDRIIDLAKRPRILSVADLNSLTDLCLCRVGSAADGRVSPHNPGEPSRTTAVTRCHPVAGADPSPQSRFE